MEDVLNLVSILIYFLLAVIALWGAFCVILAWRRVSQTRFRNEREQKEFLGKLVDQVKLGQFDAAAELCQGDRRAMPQLALFALAHRQLGFAQLRQRVLERFQSDVLSDLDDRLSWVTTVIKSAPMVGLLGTVVGMMGAFQKLSSGEKVDPAAMAENIAVALITTACGLAIAIPLVIGINTINVRIRKMQELVGSGLAQFFEVLQGKIG